MFQKKIGTTNCKLKSKITSQNTCKLARKAFKHVFKKKIQGEKKPHMIKRIKTKINTKKEKLVVFIKIRPVKKNSRDVLYFT